jgi:tyrosinase
VGRAGEDGGARRAGRALDLEIYGINHFRPSFVARVFLDDTEVDADADSERASYAGSFAIFGHRTCVGGPGHCDVPTARRRFDDRPSHPLTRAFKRVVITDALRRAVPQGGEVTVTIVATVSDDVADEVDDELLDVTGIGISVFA